MSIQQEDPTISMPSDGFHRLVEDLSRVLGPSSGIDSDDVDHLILQQLMENYVSSENEWERYALADGSRGYTRNLVDKGNGKSNLLVLVWSPGRSSPVHDHAGAHCLMKILKGSLKETLYAWPDESLIQKGECAPLFISKETVYDENEVAYISDKIGLHRISNPDTSTVAVSLHLYTPPYGTCQLFDEHTGESTNVKQCNYFSVLGHKL